MGFGVGGGGGGDDGVRLPPRFHAGTIVGRDEEAIELAEADDLFRVLASEALDLWAHGRRDTARRFKADALALRAATEQARAWLRCSAPTSLRMDDRQP